MTLSTSDSSIDYSIYPEVGSQIFSGKAYKRPGASAISFNIGDICAPYLSSDLDFSNVANSLNKLDHVRQKFYVKNSGGVTIDTVEFSNDWSYDPKGTPTIASRPVKLKVDPRQVFMMSVYGISECTVTLVGGGQTLLPPPMSDANGVIAVNSRTMKQGATFGMTAVQVNVKSSDGESSSVLYDVVSPCARYALYYVNAYGGWDSLLMTGNNKRVDNYTRATYKTVYSPADLSDRGTVNYRNDIERTISLVTDWLTDEESSRMHHLFGSTNVLLHDLVDDIIRPVTIAAKSWTEKTFRNNGAKLVNYQIDVTIAQDFVRL